MGVVIPGSASPDLEEINMSTRTKFVAIGSALVLALVIAGVALAQGMHNGMGHRHGFERMLNYYSQALNLSTDQQDQIKAIWAKEKPALEPLMQQMKQFHTQMEALTNTGTFDEVKVRALATQQSQAMTEMMVQHARIKSEMMQVLTPDQKTKFSQLEAQHQQRWMQHMKGAQGAPPSEE